MVTTTRSQGRQTRSSASKSASAERELGAADGKLTTTSKRGKKKGTQEEHGEKRAKAADEEVKPPANKRSKKEKEKGKEETIRDELVEKKAESEAVPEPDDEQKNEEKKKDENENYKGKEEIEDVEMKDENGQAESFEKTKDTLKVKNEEEKTDVETDRGDQAEPEGVEKVEDKSSESSAVEISPGRQEKTEKSSVLEMGIIYFFFRPKVSVEDPQSINDVQRSYIIFRPLPKGAKLKEAPLEDAGNNRLLAIPKKKFPSTGSHERLLTFVEKAKVPVKELKETVLKPSTYETKTRGERTTPAARPVGEGVYAILHNVKDRQSHLVYILTLPNKPNELQEEFGLQERGSYVISVRNPETPAPANVAIKKPAEFPKDMMEEFRGLRWIAALPKHLDYPNADILFIGERSGLRHSEQSDQVALEQLEELKVEDEERIEHLSGDHAIFKDLELNKKDYVGIKGTWDE